MGVNPLLDRGRSCTVEIGQQGVEAAFNGQGIGALVKAVTDLEKKNKRRRRSLEEFDEQMTVADFLREL